MNSICNHITTKPGGTWGTLNVDTTTGSLPTAANRTNSTIRSSALDNEVAWFMYNFTDELKKLPVAD